jgi:hypothetical protein
MNRISVSVLFEQSDLHDCVIQAIDPSQMETLTTHGERATEMMPGLIQVTRRLLVLVVRATVG